MKVNFYVDVFPMSKADVLFATTTPGQKIEGCKRYKIVANIPDQAFTGEIDAVAPVEEVIEVDKG